MQRSTVDILFKGERLQKTCSDIRLLKRAHGAQLAELVRRRLDELRAAPNLETMSRLPGRCHELKGDRAGTLAVDLVHPQRLIFEPSENPVPRKADGGLDRRLVTSVRVVGIEDYHD